MNPVRDNIIFWTAYIGGVIVGWLVRMFYVWSTKWLKKK